MEALSRPSFLAVVACLFTLAILTPGASARLFTYPQGDDNPCIMLETEFAIELQAYNGTPEFPLANVIKTHDDVRSWTGNCGSINAVLHLRFLGDGTWSQIFKKDANGDVTLDRLIQFIPADIFQDNVTDTQTHYLNDPGVTDLLSDTNSYKCDVATIKRYENGTEAPDDIEYVADVTIFKIQAQAYNVENGTFSPEVFCPEEGVSTSTGTPSSNLTSTPDGNITTTDMPSNVTTDLPSNVTTTEPSNTTSSDNSTTGTSTGSTKVTTTITAATPTTPPAPVNKYAVKGDNVTCILLWGALRINIKYPLNSTEDQKGTVAVNIPDDATYDGNCGLSANSQSLDIKFFGGWQVEFLFNKEANLLKALSAGPSQDSYGLSKITLTYVVDEDRFPDAKDPPGTTVDVTTDADQPDYPKKAANKAFYRCNSDTELTLNDDVFIQSKELQFKAFNEDNDEEFKGSVEECAADKDDDDDDDLIPIIIGCTIGGILLLIIFAFVVVKCRSSKRRDYKTV